MPIFKRGANATKKGITRILSDQEEIKILELLRNFDHDGKRLYFSEMADLIELLVDTGMRLGEAMNLRYKDINYTSNVISIHMDMGNNSRRVPMTYRVREVLQRRQIPDTVKPFNITSVQADFAWRWIGEQMGLKHDRQFVIYCLRRTFAIRHLDMGVEPNVIKQWLGLHANK